MSGGMPSDPAGRREPALEDRIDAWWAQARTLGVRGVVRQAGKGVGIVAGSVGLLLAIVFAGDWTLNRLSPGLGNTAANVGDGSLVLLAGILVVLRIIFGARWLLRHAWFVIRGSGERPVIDVESYPRAAVPGPDADQAAAARQASAQISYRPASTNNPGRPEQMTEHAG
jgi:hypothetical protein